jgi:hypothetical protein
VLDSLWHGSKREVSIWKNKYSSDKELHLQTKILLDSTSHAFNLASAYLVQEINYSQNLETSLKIARKNHVLYTAGGMMLSALFILFIK